MLEVVGKQPDCPFACRIKQIVPDLPLDRGSDQAVVAVQDRRFYVAHRLALGVPDHLAAKVIEDHSLFHRDRDLEEFLLFATVDGKDTVRRDLANLLGVIVILRVHRVLVLRIFRVQKSGIKGTFPDHLAETGVVGDLLRYDIARSRQRFLGAGNAQLLVDVCLRLYRKRRLVPVVLAEDQLCQRLQSLFSCHRRPGLAVRTERTVNVIHLGDRDRPLDSGGDLIGQLSLLVYQVAYLLLSLFDVAQVVEAILQIPQNRVVKAPRLLLAVTCDKGDGVALVDQSNRFLHLFPFQLQLVG